MGFWALGFRDLGFGFRVFRAFREFRVWGDCQLLL